MRKWVTEAPCHHLSSYSPPCRIACPAQLEPVQADLSIFCAPLNPVPEIWLSKLGHSHWSTPNLSTSASSRLTATVLVIIRRDWVTKCMGQMTDFNRDDVQSELRTIIADAHIHQRLWTTDWAGMQLQRCVVYLVYLPWNVSQMQPSLVCDYSLLPKPLPAVNNLKRKMWDIFYAVRNTTFLDDTHLSLVALTVHSQTTRKPRRALWRMHRRIRPPWTQVIKQRSIAAHSDSSVSTISQGKRTLAIAVGTVADSKQTTAIYFEITSPLDRHLLGVQVDTTILRPIPYVALMLYSACMSWRITSRMYRIGIDTPSLGQTKKFLKITYGWPQYAYIAGN